jgi:hypothetical protein
VESEHVRVQCLPGIRTKYLQRVMKSRDLGSPDTVVIHVGTNDLRRTANLDYVMGDVYALMNKAKTKFPQSKLVLSGVLRSRNVSWWRIGALNSRYDWIAKTLGVTFVDPNSWTENWDFGRVGLHINRSVLRRLCQLYSRVCGFGGGGQNSKERLLLSTNNEGTPERTGKTITEERPTLVWQTTRREEAQTNHQIWKKTEEVTSE